MEKSTITSKGQTTIPAEIRAFLGIGVGDELQYTKTKSGKVEISPRKRYSWRDLQTILPKPPKKAVTIRQMDKAIGEYLSKKHRRILETGSSEES